MDLDKKAEIMIYNPKTHEIIHFNRSFYIDEGLTLISPIQYHKYYFPLKLSNSSSSLDKGKSNKVELSKMLFENSIKKNNICILIDEYKVIQSEGDNFRYTTFFDLIAKLLNSVINLLHYTYEVTTKSIITIVCSTYETLDSILLNIKQACMNISELGIVLLTIYAIVFIGSVLWDYSMLIINDSIKKYHKIFYHSLS